MKNNIFFRKIKTTDYTALEKIIRDTWDYEKFCSPDTAKHMAKLYLASCLANQTFTCVAVNNGEPVGIIMGNDEKHPHTPLQYRLFQLGAGALLLSSKDGRRVAKLFAGFEKIDKILLKKSGMVFDGQLAFFVIRSDQRGLGIGKQLFAAFRSYMKKMELNNFYLYTDNKCNFGFYEHQGLVRIGKKICNLKPPINEQLQFFLYAYDTAFLA